MCIKERVEFLLETDPDARIIDVYKPKVVKNPDYIDLLAFDEKVKRAKELSFKAKKIESQGDHWYETYK